MHVIAGKAVAFRIALGDEFRRDQRRTVENAAILAETLAGRGARVVSGGTDNHLMLVDVMPLGVTGREAEHAARRGRDHRQQEPDPVRHPAGEHVVRASGSGRRR